MLSYSIRLEPDDNGTFLVTCADFPELTTFGDDLDEALARALNALEEAIAARMDEREDIPVPSAGDNRVALPALSAVKVVLYQEMRSQDIGKAELGRRLGWPLPKVDHVLDLQHRSRLDQLAAALNVVGRQLEVSAAQGAAST